MADAKFLGFEMKDGRLYGDYTNLMPIVENFVGEFNEEKVYVYEVGTLILFHYMRQMGMDGIVPIYNKKRKSFFDKLRNFFCFK